MPRKPTKARSKPAEPAGRRVRYCVAMSLDGFIAGPKGEADWIVMDPEFDFEPFNAQFDSMLMGRRTYEAMTAMGGGGSTPGMTVYVASRTLKQADHPGVTMVNDLKPFMADLRSKPGKDVWLFGGGSLFRSLAENGWVDTVEVGVMPVLLGEGVPLLSGPGDRVQLKLTAHQLFPKSGTLSLEYAVEYGRTSNRRR